jgi:hypothetical protein
MNAPMLSLLLACALGLDTVPERGRARGDDDSGATDSGSPDTASDSGSRDTGAWTDTGDAREAPRVSTLEPAHGTVAGGQDVVVTGENLDRTTTVRFGGTAAEVVRVEAGRLVARTPAGTAAGPVNVVVENGAGSTTLEDGFFYVEDGTGRFGLYGLVAWNSYAGDYWADAAEDGVAWMIVTPPQALNLWELYASSLDSCATGYRYGGEFYYIDVEVSRARLSAGTAALDLTWSATDGSYALEGFTRGWSDGATYDLAQLAGPVLPAFAHPGALRAPAAFPVSSPAIDAASPPTVARGFDLTWSGSAGDFVLIALALTDAAGSAIAQEVTCVARDDGRFAVPSGAFTTWGAGRVLYVSVGRATRGTGTRDLDNAGSQLHGLRWVHGAAYTR